jgi:hypothetical protein
LLTGEKGGDVKGELEAKIEMEIVSLLELA